MTQNTDCSQDNTIREAEKFSDAESDPDRANELIAALLDIIYDLDSQITYLKHKHD